MRTVLRAAAGCTALLLLQSTAFASPVPFPDMAESWFGHRQAVADLVESGVLTGYPDGTFRPHDTVNRAEFLKMVFQGKSSRTPTARRCFFDVAPQAWYAPYVCAAKSRKIVSGYPSGAFKPGNPVTYAEAIKMLLHAYGHDVEPASGKDWFVPYVTKLDALGVLPAHAYVPWHPLSREHAADLLHRMLGLDQSRRLPRYSAGCNRAAPVTRPSRLTVQGRERTFIVSVPSAYRVHDPAPLVVAFHGRTNSNDMVQGYMDLDHALTDSIVVYPAALRASPSSFTWADPDGRQPADLAFFDALVETLSEQYCVDLDRIAVVGHSLGAWMANTVACARGDVVMASATVGGDGANIPCAGPAAALIAHNPKDNLAPFAGSERVRTQRLAANACTPATIPGPGDLNCVRHTQCANGNDVLWCPHTINTDYRGTYYPHTWPNSMGQRIAEFFQSIQ